MELFRDGLRPDSWQPWLATASALVSGAALAYLLRRLLARIHEPRLARRLWIGAVLTLALLFAPLWLHYGWLRATGHVEKAQMVAGELHQLRLRRAVALRCEAELDSVRGERWTTALDAEACTMFENGQRVEIPFLIGDRLRFIRQTGRYPELPFFWLVVYACVAIVLGTIALLLAARPRTAADPPSA